MAWDEDPGEPGGTATRALAKQIGLPVEEFVDVFGAGWQPLPNAEIDFDADPFGEGHIFGPWYIAGDPFQLMLRVRPEIEAVELARPKGSWAGHRLVWRPDTDSELVPLTGPWQETAGQVVKTLLRRRRTSFRYCRYCRELTPPEHRLDADLCQGCATIWHGVIY